MGEKQCYKEEFAELLRMMDVLVKQNNILIKQNFELVEIYVLLDKGMATAIPFTMKRKDRIWQIPMLLQILNPRLKQPNISIYRIYSF